MFHASQNTLECPYCQKSFRSQHSVDRHISHAQECKAKKQRDVAEKKQRAVAEQYQASHSYDNPRVSPQMDDTPMFDIESSINFNEESVQGSLHDGGDQEMEDATYECDAGGIPTHLVVEEYPETDGLKPGHVYGRVQTTFETEKKKRDEAGLSSWSPFKDREEWELAQWLLKSGLSQTAIDRFLKLRIVSHSNDTMNLARLIPCC